MGAAVLLVMIRKGESKLLSSNFLFLVALVLAAVGILLWLGSYRNHAAFWEDYYAKEIARQIDLADSGSIVELDLTQALVVATRNHKDPYSLVSIDNEHNRVIVSLREGGARSFMFFSDVEVVNEGIRLPENRIRLRLT